MEKTDTDLLNEKTYDSAFWTGLDKLRGFVIPLVNEVFGEHFTDHASIHVKNNKHIVEETDGSLRQLDTDGYVEISEMLDRFIQHNYHFECETWYRKGIAVRIEEYESTIAMENLTSVGNVINVYHPKSAVIFLHSDSAIPPHFILRHWNPAKDSYMEIQVPAIQITDYSIDSLFEKRLLLLLPFFAFHFSEKDFMEMEEDFSKFERLKTQLDGINRRLTQLVDKGEIEIWQKSYLVDLMKRVFEKAAIKYESVSKGVVSVMGGFILHTETDDILNRGKAEGRAEGREEGRAEGKVEEYIALRREDGYSDTQLVDGIVHRFHLGKEEAQKYVAGASVSV